MEIRPPNILLVVLDSVRAANCSLYGAPRETTPFLSTLAEESVTYTQARAPANWSLPSHISLFTGLDTHEHRVTIHDRLLSGHTVFESLAGDGYATGLFTENGFLNGHEVGIAECFQTVVGVPDEYDKRYDTTDINPGPDGFYYADQFLDWNARQDGPWAACLNLMDAHRPYEPRAEVDRWGDQRAGDLQRELDTRWEWAFHSGDRPYWQLGGLESLYDGGIRQADAIVKRTLETLRERGALEETLVVICGDHGEGFGEPGHIAGEPPATAHIVPMHESLLHVPLLVRPPGGAAGTCVHEPAALTSFPAVVRRYVSGDPPERGFAADSVVSLKQPVTADLRERFERHCESADQFLAQSRAVYTNADGKAVRKRYYWGAEGLEQLVYSAGSVETEETIATAAVDAAFDEEDAGVREPLDGKQAGEDVKEQLAALGYY